jgi:hypothetical protein
MILEKLVFVSRDWKTQACVQHSEVRERLLQRPCEKSSKVVFRPRATNVLAFRACRVLSLVVELQMLQISQVPMINIKAFTRVP